jgi:hypothetical protein
MILFVIVLTYQIKNIKITVSYKVNTPSNTTSTTHLCKHLQHLCFHVGQSGGGGGSVVVVFLLHHYVVFLQQRRHLLVFAEKKKNGRTKIEEKVNI